ncbi:hypothetical protein LSH36_53g01002 [Paralvinella palmiformis]|uniref:KY-like immunoglobulin-like domain-containing protein n=1 Tax=Paralvinella palmiformis TaxID=53620 RepID=A0AAD9K699_9ANNE|nr:hypothetical protein LSH36_53g01002 [Paralvinella palmiformis]
MGCGSSKIQVNGDVTNLERILDLSVKDKEEEESEKIEIITDRDNSPFSKLEPLEPTDVVEIDFQEYFIQFPTASLLQEANKKYGKGKQPLLRTDDGELLPYPVSTSKSSVFVQSKYTDVDLFATQIFTNLLTSKYSGDEMSVTRVIFRWLATQDLNQSCEVSSDDDSVLWNLKTLEKSPGYYSEMFLRMCRFAGLQIKPIRGYVKHAHLEPGDTPDVDELNSWVAVVINDEWRLIDPHWGSSHMTGEDPGGWLLIDDNGQGGKSMEKESEKTVYSCNEVYFLTDPEQFIYSHIPVDDEDMQLLARPVTHREFIEMAYLKPPFFDLELRLLEHRKCVLYASEGEIDIQIGIPPEKRRSFMYRLWISNQERIEDVKLERFCIMQQKNNKLFCKIYFPSVEGVKAFPENERREWGPGPDLEAAGLLPVSHQEALIEAIDGTVEVRFKMTDDVAEILHQLHSNNKTRDELKRNVVHYIDHKTNEMVLLLILPDPGDYALNILAESKDADGKYSNVCSYIVSTECAAADWCLFPDLANGRIGSTAGQSELSLRLVSHDSPVIRCLETGELELLFESSVSCETITSLGLQLNDGGVKVLENLVWTKYEVRLITFRIRFPECGRYVLKVFAKKLGTEGSYQHAYTCLLHVTVPMETCLPFPSCFAQWKTDCDILEPTVNVLLADSKIMFTADVPSAWKMSVIDSDNRWMALDKDEDNIWRTEVETGNPGELRLCGQLERDSDTYLTLLSYTVIGENALQMEAKKQQLAQEEAKTNNSLKKEERKAQEDERSKIFEKYKQDLTDALRTRDLTKMKDALRVVERKKYVGRLQSLVEEARQMIKSLKRIQKLKQAILKLDQNTMLEIKNYQNPPKGVHEVMISTLLILGDSEKATKIWSDCQKCLVTIGKEGLFRRVTNFDLTALNAEIAARALYIIGRFRVDDITVSSAGAAVFYNWTTGMIGELYQTDPDAKNANPANIWRQKQILDALKSSLHTNKHRSG